MMGKELIILRMPGCLLIAEEEFFLILMVKGLQIIIILSDV